MSSFGPKEASLRGQRPLSNGPAVSASQQIKVQSRPTLQQPINHQSKRPAIASDKYKRGETSTFRGSGGPVSPMGNEKTKKIFGSKLNRLIEDNMRLKAQQQELKEQNQKYLDILGSKERQNRVKGYLLQNAGNELGFHQSKFEIMRANLLKLDYRERFQEKNLRGLINYAKKLTRELEEYREKVKMAEKIIQDLRDTGSESLDSLIHMLKSYQQKQNQIQEEIKKLKQLVLIKDDEITGLDEDIYQLRGFVTTAKDKLEDKIQELLHTLDENRQLIRKQDKYIVDLQQKNEVSQISIATTAEEAQRKRKEKLSLQLKIKELEDQKGNLTGHIANIESKLVTYRTMQGSQQNQPYSSESQHTQYPQQNQQQQSSIQWRENAEIVPANGAGAQANLACNGKSPLKSAMSHKSAKHSRGESTVLSTNNNNNTAVFGDDHGKATQSASVEEKFTEPILDELKLEEWVFWEHYDDLGPTGHLVKDKAYYLASMVKVGWFKDIVTFWQVWNNLPVHNLENFFYDKETEKIPTYNIKGNMKRISQISLFRKGILPSWEDPINAAGGEFQATLNLSDKNFSNVNELWETFILDVVSNRFPYAQEIVGVRIVDKSRGGPEFMFVLQVWTKFKEENGEPARQIRDFIFKEYLDKFMLGSKLTFKDHLGY